jgi:hypothetical protein
MPVSVPDKVDLLPQFLLWLPLVPQPLRLLPTLACPAGPLRKREKQVLVPVQVWSEEAKA